MKPVKNIIIYHFVRDVENTKYPVHAISTKRFREHLEYIKKDKENYLLTFDDGYKDHCMNAMPLLKEYDVRGIFFVCIQPLFENKVFSFNKNQFLLSRLGTEKMVEEFEGYFSTKINREANQYKDNRFDDVVTANLKWAIHNLDEKARAEFLDRLFTEHVGDENEFSKKLYMSWNDLKKVVDAGIEIGSHSWFHPLLSNLSKKEQIKEIKESKDLLESRLGIKVDAFCYPYGKYNEDTLSLLKSSGYKHAVTTNYGQNTNDANPLLLNRIDAAELCK